MNNIALSFIVSLLSWIKNIYNSVWNIFTNTTNDGNLVLSTNNCLILAAVLCTFAILTDFFVKKSRRKKAKKEIKELLKQNNDLVINNDSIVKEDNIIDNFIENENNNSFYKRNTYDNEENITDYDYTNANNYQSSANINIDYDQNTYSNNVNDTNLYSNDYLNNYEDNLNNSAMRNTETFDNSYAQNSYASDNIYNPSNVENEYEYAKETNNKYFDINNQNIDYSDYTNTDEDVYIRSRQMKKERKSNIAKLWKKLVPETEETFEMPRVECDISEKEAFDCKMQNKC